MRYGGSEGELTLAFTICVTLITDFAPVKVLGGVLRKTYFLNCTAFCQTTDVHSVRDTTAPPKSKDGVNGQAGLRFVARQPVFDRATKVFGYELLFRDGSESGWLSLTGRRCNGLVR